MLLSCLAAMAGAFSCTKGAAVWPAGAAHAHPNTCHSSLSATAHPAGVSGGHGGVLVRNRAAIRHAACNLAQHTRWAGTIAHCCLAVARRCTRLSDCHLPNRCQHVGQPWWGFFAPQRKVPRWCLAVAAALSLPSTHPSPLPPSATRSAGPHAVLPQLVRPLLAAGLPHQPVHCSVRLSSVCLCL